MLSASFRNATVLAVLGLLLLASPALISAQDPKSKPDDVVRVNTELAQTDVVVLDKNGKFVDGLTSEQFELRVNGNARAIAHFDRVVAGAASEEEQLAAARGQSRATGPVRQTFGGGRTILFYVDDVHLSTNSLTRTREMLSDFVERQMKTDDLVALVTTTGQLGFLEQPTNEKVVLQHAIAKLAHRSFSTADAERMQMSETEAAAILSEDRRLLDYFVDQLLRDMGRRPRGASTNPMKTRLDAEQSVRARAKSIIDQSTALAVNTLSGLERLLQVTSSLPWRKTLFFVSDGFIIHDRSNTGVYLQRSVATASHGLTTIYSIDAQGLSSGVIEASRRSNFDYGRNGGANFSAISSTQESLQTLAADTGGIAILNSNSPSRDLTNALTESANYYLVSWRPEEKELTDTRRMTPLEISVKGRTDLIVRTRRSYANASEEKPKVASPSKKRDPESPLMTALHSYVPRLELPVALSAGYVDGGSDALVTATIEIPLRAFNTGDATDGEVRELDLMGAAIDATGKSVGIFDQGFKISPAEIRAAQSESALVNHQLSLPPGLYQIRVAVQERKSLRLGSAMQWLEVPDLKTRPFALSSLFIGEVNKNTRDTGKLSANAAHRFRSGSEVGFFVVVYNAKDGPAACDVALQIQIFRDDQPVVTKPLVKVSPAPDPTGNRISYGEVISLDQLPAGSYVLRVTAIDRLAKASGQQQTRFTIY